MRLCYIWEIHSILQFLLIFSDISLLVFLSSKFHKKINFSCRSMLFVSSVNLSKWNLSPSFLNSLQNHAINLQLNSKERDNFLFLLFTSSGPHLYYSLNVYCSLRQYLSSKNYLFISLDLNSFKILQNHSIPTVLYSKKLPKFDITVFRLVVAYNLLLMGIDVVHSDSDLVYFDDPIQLFSDKYDLEISYEKPYLPSSYSNYSGNFLNCGFWKMKSTKKSILFMENWIKSCELIQLPDQESLVEYLKTQEYEWIENDTVLYNLANLNFNWTIRYFDNLLVTCSYSFYSKTNRILFLDEARRRNINRPIIYHLAWFWANRKPSALHEKNAWFIDFPKSKNCKKIPPNGTSCFWNKDYDTKDIKEIPRKFHEWRFPR